MKLVLFLLVFFYLEDNIDETYGINVQFEESEEEDDEDVYGEIREGDDHEDEGEESKLDATIHAENVSYFILFNDLFK
jgi:pre-mRNA-splicing helicase BRR2